MLEDHDLAAEAAVRALGGEPPACLDVLDRWRRLCALDLAPGRLRNRGPEPLRATHPASRPAGCDGVPEPLVDVLMAAWTLHAARDQGPTAFPAVPDLVRATLQHRAQAALRASLQPARQGGASTRLDVAVGVLPAGGQPQVDIDVGPRAVTLRLLLPVTWLIEVGATGGVIGPAFLLRRRGGCAVALRWAARGRRLCPALVELRLGRGEDGWLVLQELPARGGAFWSVRTSR